MYRPACVVCMDMPACREYTVCIPCADKIKVGISKYRKLKPKVIPANIPCECGNRRIYGYEICDSCLLEYALAVLNPLEEKTYMAPDPTVQLHTTKVHLPTGHPLSLFSSVQSIMSHERRNITNPAQRDANLLIEGVQEQAQVAQETNSAGLSWLYKDAVVAPKTCPCASLKCRCGGHAASPSVHRHYNTPVVSSRLGDSL